MLIPLCFPGQPELHGGCLEISTARIFQKRSFLLSSSTSFVCWHVSLVGCRVLHRIPHLCTQHSESVAVWGDPQVLPVTLKWSASCTSPSTSQTRVSIHSIRRVMCSEVLGWTHVAVRLLGCRLVESSMYWMTSALISIPPSRQEPVSWLHVDWRKGSTLSVGTKTVCCDCIPRKSKSSLSKVALLLHRLCVSSREPGRYQWFLVMAALCTTRDSVTFQQDAASTKRGARRSDQVAKSAPCWSWQCERVPVSWRTPRQLGGHCHSVLP